MMNASNPVYLELIDLIVSHATPEGLLHFRPSEANQHRVAELIAARHDGTLSVEEASELDDFVQIEHVLIMAKARARRRLQIARGN
jgi:hypothetical protein